MSERTNLEKVSVLRRVSGACGITSQLLGLAVILVTVFNSPWFSWTENDISVLGVEGSMTALFNWGLILTGLFYLVFAVGLSRSLPSSWAGKSGGVSLILGSVALSAVGIFPRTFDLPHDTASVGFYVLMALALLLVGVVAIRSSRMLAGWLSMAGGVLMIVFLLIPWPWSGGAIEQLLSCVPLSLWTVAFGVRMISSLPPLFRS